MSEPAPPSVQRGQALAAGWPTALIRGLLAFSVMALIGQIVAFATYLASGAGSVATFAKLGWFYFGWFHHVRVVVELPGLALGQEASQAIGGGLAGGASLSYHAGLALTLVTLLAGWLLFTAGRAVAREAGGGPVARAFHGMKVAPAYALPAFLISLVVSIDAAIPQNAFVSGRVEVHASELEAFLFPFLVALVAGAIGGLSVADEASRNANPWLRRGLAALGGGVRMFLLGLALAFVGLLVLAVVQPDATKAYFSAVSEPPADETAVLIAHHVLVLPNQSMWVLVPAMGSCDGAYGSGFSVPFLCYWKFPKSVEASLISPQLGLGGASSPVSARFGWAPFGYFLFLLVPLLSVVAGGWHAARRGMARTPSEGGALGAAAGVVFAIFVAVGIWFSSITAGITASFLGISGGGSIRIGPDLLGGGITALAWGVAGGSIGGWWMGRRVPAPPPEATGFGPGPMLPPPPSAGAPVAPEPVPPGESAPPDEPEPWAQG
ncbi:MAG TPA: DUF6350 family protein [Actinomycetota bacterium]